MIRFQEGMTLQQILRLFKDPKQKVVFNRQELTIKSFHYIFLFATTFVFVVLYSQVFFNYPSFEVFILVINYRNWITPAILILTGCTLLCNLYTKYHEQFKIQRLSILVFIFTNVFTFIVYNLYTLLYLEKIEVINFAFFVSLYCGNRTAIQAMGFIFVKKSRDPLHGICELEYTQMISSV